MKKRPGRGWPGAHGATGITMPGPLVTALRLRRLRDVLVGGGRVDERVLAGRGELQLERRERSSLSRTARLGTRRRNPAGTHTVVWRFPDLDMARQVYDSDACRAVLGDRLGASTPKFAVLVETVAE